VVDVLLGGDTARIRELGHGELSVYGIGRELDRGQWRSLFRQLLALGLLVSDPDGHGGLRFGAEERVKPLLRGERSLALRLPPPARERRRTAAAEARTAQGSAQGARAAGALLSEADEVLFQALREWRREQARSQGVPPYVVFHDRTLAEIAAARPASLDDLAGIGGVGRAKLERYGEAVLGVIGTMSSSPEP
jgi:ATP-dependent DNA helicase RecQ